MNTTTNFDFSSIPSTKPASYKQVKFRAGNVAVALLFNKLGLIPETGLKATNYKLFSQMGMALQTATVNKPLTHGDIQEMGKNPAKFAKIFHAAFQELFLTPSGLEKLLKSDKVPAAKIKKAIKAYSEITGKEVATVAVRKSTADDKATIAVKESKTPKNLNSVAGVAREITELSKTPKTPKNLNSVASIEREIDKLYLMMERLSLKNS